MSESAALRFREASEDDLEALIRMLADDALGRERELAEDPPAACYVDAFRALDRDPNQRLLVAESAGEIVAMLQLSLIPGLSHRGAWRAQVESVRVASGNRQRGVGRRLLAHAVDLARSRGCRIVQLTTDKRRPDALRFYRAAGFEATHEGLKLSAA